MYDNNDRECLMRQLQCLFFVLDDIRLFLDTHPCDPMALECYDKFRKLKDEALAEYTSRFGPMDSYNVDLNKCDCWTWVETPWPWERWS